MRSQPKRKDDVEHLVCHSKPYNQQGRINNIFAEFAPGMFHAFTKFTFNLVNILLVTSQHVFLCFFGEYAQTMIIFFLSSVVKCISTDLSCQLLKLASTPRREKLWSSARKRNANYKYEMSKSGKYRMLNIWEGFF